MSESTTKRVRLGLIGCGKIVRMHLRQLAQIPEVDIVAVTEPSKANFEMNRELQPELLANVKLYDDYKTMLKEVDLDAVQIHTPHTMHYEQAKTALEHGLHVLTEKPLVVQVDHAYDLLDAAERSGKILMISYQRHLQATYRYIRRSIMNGDIGEVSYVSALLAQSWKAGGTVNRWRVNPEMSGGGELMDSGSHLVDILLWMTGLAVTQVYAEVDNCGMPVEINSSLAFRFNNGAMGNLSIIGDSPVQWHEDITISGTEGAFYLRNGKLFQSGPDRKLNEVTLDETDSNPDRNFIDAILGRDEVQVPAICGLRVIELTQAAYESAKQGRMIKVEEFRQGRSSK